MSMISKDAEAANEAGIELSPDPNAPLKLPVNASKLTKWNAAMSLFHGVFAAITLAVGNTDLAVPVYGSGVKVIVGGLNGTNVGTNATDGWALKPDFSSVSSHIHLTWAVACFFGLSCLFHLGNALLWKPLYLRALEKGYAPFRWIEYSMSASVMILILAYTSGTTTQPVLVSLFGFTAITMAFGHLHEVVCRPKSLEAWAISNKLERLQAHLIGYVPQCFAWGLVIAQFMEAGGSSATDSQGEKSQMPTFVYGIVFGELLIFWCFGLVQLIVSLRPPAKYYQGEIAYMWLSLLAKGVLGLLVLSNVLVLQLHRYLCLSLEKAGAFLRRRVRS